MVLGGRLPGRVGRCRFFYLYYKMKLNKITVFILFFLIVVLAKKNFAHPFYPYTRDVTIKKDEISILYENYTRKSKFFFDYSEDLKFNNYGLKYSYKLPTLWEYHICVLGTYPEIKSRKSTSMGYEARLGLNKDLWGDNVVYPLWRILLDISGGAANQYKKDKIDIEYKYLSVNLGLMISRRFGRYVIFSGAGFSYTFDNYTEDITEETYDSKISGFFPFVGVRGELLKYLSVQIESNFIDQKGISASILFSLP